MNDVQEPDGPQEEAGSETPVTVSTDGNINAGIDTDELEQQVIAVLRTVFDPEIPVNIYELGLVYDVDVQPTGAVKVSMTLTSPACPVAGSLPGEVQAKVAKVPGVTQAEIELVWEPSWNPSLMSDAARLQLGMF